jgi:hypothetical protein
MSAKLKIDLYGSWESRQYIHHTGIFLGQKGVNLTIFMSLQHSRRGQSFSNLTVGFFRYLTICDSCVKNMSKPKRFYSQLSVDYYTGDSITNAHN